MKQVALLLVGTLGAVAVAVVTFRIFQAAGAAYDLAGGGGFVDDDIDTRAILSSVPPSAFSPPAQGRRAEVVEDLYPSSAPLLDSVDLGRELLLGIAAEIGDGWMPTEKAFVEHVDLRVGNVAGLGLGYVRELLGEDEVLAWPMYYSALQADGDLGSAIDMPTDDDVRRLWTPEIEELFAMALEHWHVAAELEEAAYLMRNRDSIFDKTIELSKSEQFSGDHAWTTIFRQRSNYAHWAFLMRVAERHVE